jgi:hypothetical protein
MRETLHILRKDARALWPQILLAVAATAVASGYDPEKEHAEKLFVILVLSRWYLVVCAIQQEKLVGDREWWLTRPYSWRSLLAAKALLIALFINLPLLLTDVAQMTSQHVSLAWGHLAARQAGLALTVVLPAAALAAVTDSVVTFGLAGLGMLVLLLFPAAKGEGLARWGPLLWIPTAAVVGVLAVAAIALLLWQYSRRPTKRTRGVLGSATVFGAIVLFVPPGGWGVGIATNIAPAPPEAQTIHLELNQAESPMVVAGPEDTVSFPVHLAAVPDGMLLVPDLVKLEADAPDGTHWRSGWRAVFYFPAAGLARWTWHGSRDAILAFGMEHGVIGRLRAQRVTWRISAAMTVLGPERTQSVEPVDEQFTVKDFGICQLGPIFVYGRLVNCRNGTPPMERVATTETSYQFAPDDDWLWEYTFNPTPVWHAPVMLPLDWKGPAITFRMRKSIAYIRCDLTERIRIEGYQ